MVPFSRSKWESRTEWNFRVTVALRVTPGTLPPPTTYAESNVRHDRWRDVYGRNPSQLRFDDEIYRWLSQQIQPRGFWLDAGCGSGEHSIRLARLFADVVAVDLSPKVLKSAAEEAERQGLS